MPWTSGAASENNATWRQRPLGSCLMAVTLLDSPFRRTGGQRGKHLAQDGGQIEEGGERELRRADDHALARGGLQHPRRELPSVPGGRLDVHALSRAHSYAARNAHPSSPQRVPAIRDLRFIRSVCGM